MRTIIIAIFCLFGTFAFSQSETVRVKTEMKAGKDGYPGGWGFAYFKQPKTNSWAISNTKLTGIPKDWNEYYRKDILFQRNQFIFQNYKEGNITDSTFTDLFQKMGLDTAGNKYSSEPIACFSTLIYRQKNNGKVEYMVDTDADGDFSDEESYKPLKGAVVKRLESTIKKVPYMQYELFVNNRIVRDSVPFMTFSNESEKHGKYLAYTFPIYSEGIFGDETFVVTPSKVDFSTFTVSTKTQLNNEIKTHEWEKAKRGDRVNYFGDWYEISHFDRANMELVLDKVDLEKDSISPTVGFYAPDFEFEVMDTGKEMKLSDLQAKYVLLDFWGTWCSPCVKGIPDLVKLHEELKEEPFEIISIAVKSKREAFDELIEEHGMDWLHAWEENGSGGMVQLYNVDAFPSFILIAPDGKIVSKANYTDKIKDFVIQTDPSALE
ncbi:thiol-disulfide isomerase-like thioredoxin [Owenweeksia hongkongensis DSM 17368]|uniref:Thiol-disulfide isomerase-like thioredoxin n=1 Tax=Owenweeksia hongkongensis (strain DSM 17368 / CIP 108786 / JCM 12287 / NRRL B-23963 / UST20020801) TaxID=926562 RepID=G8R5F9_OWEHD|nr:TlpA disulfide reductase family protein [Owenweeksia hongkongensis]AEV33233.1 thiol-disulfide isomerase-like thioredoxin [Owenweeksia hongkongensis DSM 17368]